MRAYFDYNASSPPYPEVIAEMTRVLATCAGNASSIHAEGRRVRELIESARDRVAALVGASPRRIVFTSGATEANNTALRGFAALAPDGIIATTTIEHHSILATVAALEAMGTRVARVGVERSGRLDTAALGDPVREGRALASVGAANGETGHVADLDAVRAVLTPDALLHVDAAQAVGRIPVAVDRRIDLLSLSAHKFGGPTGVGALVVPDDRRWRPLLTGGPQERRLRAGTENVAGIAGFGVAAELARARMHDEAVRCRRLRESLWSALAAQYEDLLRITPDDGLPNTLTIAIPGIRSEVLIAGLDLAGYAVSTGSACATGAPEPSHVVAALGIERGYSEGVVRISMGHATTEESVHGLAAAFVEVVGRAREAA